MLPTKKKGPFCYIDRNSLIKSKVGKNESANAFMRGHIVKREMQQTQE